MKKVLIVDTEGDGLDPNILWCICCEDYLTGEEFDYTVEDPDYISKFKAKLEEYDVIVGHYFLGYDRPALKKLYGIHIPVSKIEDTFVLSKLFSPLREGGHSVENWAKKFGLFKQEHEDWSKFSKEMLTRCRSDVKINRKIYQYLLKEGSKWSEKSKRIEHNTQAILEECRRYGFKFDVPSAHKLYQECFSKAEALRYKIQQVFLPQPKLIRTVEVKVKKDGSFYTSSVRPMDNLSDCVCGDYSLIEYKEFDLNSPSQIRERLAPYWHPFEMTPKGNPKVSEDNLNTISDDAPEEAKLLREYTILTNRHRMINTWLESVGNDGRIHGKIFSIGAVTHRCSHISPNTANIPGVLDKRGRANPYGRECRALWGVAESRRLLGVDAKGIQARILADRMGDQEYINIVLDPKGDVHTYHMSKTKYGTRSQNKTFFYAWVLGAQAKKVGSIFGVSPKIGAEIMDNFLSNFPALQELKQRMEKLAERGWYKASDGRYIPIKSKRHALSVLLQGEEQAIMKTSLILDYQQYTKESIDAHLVGFVHDEKQIDCIENQAVYAGSIAAANIAKAGGILGFHRCPMEGDVKIGNTWADTH